MPKTEFVGEDIWNHISDLAKQSDRRYVAGLCRFRR